ncbi:hypothetical protein CK203_057987 [Vitis vinifera]|uniref:Uncharacterized protein n=1 Tax=Vitis vinifera TaxID=29760 RepID=A0A438GIU9_VITVI|nr:hypothetical protein CK203_057987 [Vitis vinifera]
MSNFQNLFPSVRQLASGSAGSAGSLSQLRGRNPGGSNAKRGMSIKGERIGEQRTGGDILERGNFADEKNKRSVESSKLRALGKLQHCGFLKRRVTASQFWKSSSAYTDHILVEILRNFLTEFGIFYQPAEPVQHHSWQPLSAMRNTCLSLSGSHSSGLGIENRSPRFWHFSSPYPWGLKPICYRALVSHLEGLSQCLISVSMGNFEVMGGVRLARDHRYASLALRLARDHSESRRSGGSGEGPQIGDSTGDRTQNLWFHKRIKLELELGLLIEIDLGSRAWIRIGDRLVRGSIHPASPAIADSGSTLHDSTTPPPPPPSGPTIQQDYIVPPPPPPPVQSAPQAGAFVLHGQTETTPHSVVAPTDC